MYRELGLSDTRLGMILLYSAVNVSLAVWLLKGFIDEIPREYEEAAMVDGYTRLQAFRKVVLPQATTGIVATAIFCLIFAWNEYAFAVLLTSGTAQTAPPFIPIIIGEGGQDWPAVAAGTTLLPRTHSGLHDPASQTPAARHHFRGGEEMKTDLQTGRSALRRGPMELLACVFITLGIVMMLQPLALMALYTWSFLTTPLRHRDVHGRLQVPGMSPTAMAQIRVHQLHKAFAEFTAVAGLELHRAGRRILLPARPLGLRQDHHASHDRRAGTAHLRARSSWATRTSASSAPRPATSPLCFQMFALYPHMNVRKNIAFPLVWRKGMPKAEIERRVLKRRHRTLQHQRSLLDSSVSRACPVATASVWHWAAPSCASRMAFLMDEPLGRAGRRVPRGDVHTNCVPCTTACTPPPWYVTHDQTEAMAMADTIAVMNRGLIEQLGAPLDVYERPASVFVADFIGSPAMNFHALSKRR